MHPSPNPAEDQDQRARPCTRMHRVPHLGGYRVYLSSVTRVGWPVTTWVALPACRRPSTSLMAVVVRANGPIEDPHGLISVNCVAQLNFPHASFTLDDKTAFDELRARVSLATVGSERRLGGLHTGRLRRSDRHRHGGARQWRRRHVTHGDHRAVRGRPDHPTVTLVHRPTSRLMPGPQRRLRARVRSECRRWPRSKQHIGSSRRLRACRRPF